MISSKKKFTENKGVEYHNWLKVIRNLNYVITELQEERKRMR